MTIRWFHLCSTLSSNKKMSFPDHMAYRPHHACTLSRYSPCKLSTAVSSSINHAYQNSDTLLSTAVILSCIRQILLSTAVVLSYIRQLMKAFQDTVEMPKRENLNNRSHQNTAEYQNGERLSQIRRIHRKEPPFYRSCVHKLEGTHWCLGLSEENRPFQGSLSIEFEMQL